MRRSERNFWFNEVVSSDSIWRANSVNSDGGGWDWSDMIVVVVLLLLLAGVAAVVVAACLVLLLA